jgi:penicillin-binding protein 1A
MKFDTLRGYRGPEKKIEPRRRLGRAVGEVPALYDVPEWRLAVVLESDPSGSGIGLQPGREVSGRSSKPSARRSPVASRTWAGRCVTS